MARLGQHIREKGTLNKVVAGRTDQQYTQDRWTKNKEQIKQNREVKVECEICGATVSKAWRGRHQRQTVKCRAVQYLMKHQPDSDEIERLCRTQCSNKMNDIYMPYLKHIKGLDGEMLDS